MSDITNNKKRGQNLFQAIGSKCTNALKENRLAYVNKIASTKKNK